MLVRLILAFTAACVVAPAASARPLGDLVEPALLLNLDFGGSAPAVFGLGLRLNHSTPVRQALAALSANPGSRQAYDGGMGSHLLDVPPLAQFEFNRQGFRRASLVGLPLVTRHLRLNQVETEPGAETPGDEASADEVSVEEGVVQQGMSEESLSQPATPPADSADEMSQSAGAEDTAWYDYSQWGWKGWSLAAAGVVGASLLVGGGGGNNSDPAPASSNPPTGTPCTTTVPTPLPPGCTP